MTENPSDAWRQSKIERGKVRRRVKRDQAAVTYAASVEEGSDYAWRLPHTSLTEQEGAELSVSALYRSLNYHTVQLGHALSLEAWIRACYGVGGVLLEKEESVFDEFDQLDVLRTYFSECVLCGLIAQRKLMYGVGDDIIKMLSNHARMLHMTGQTKVCKLTLLAIAQLERLKRKQPNMYGVLKRSWGLVSELAIERVNSRVSALLKAHHEVSAATITSLLQNHFFALVSRAFVEILAGKLGDLDDPATYVHRHLCAARIEVRRATASSSESASVRLSHDTLEKFVGEFLRLRDPDNTKHLQLVRDLEQRFRIVVKAILAGKDVLGAHPKRMRGSSRTFNIDLISKHIMSKARDATTGGKYLSPRLDSVDKLARQFELSVEQKRALVGI
jgi:hypothetical protein